MIEGCGICWRTLLLALVSVASVFLAVCNVSRCVDAEEENEDQGVSG